VRFVLILTAYFLVMKSLIKSRPKKTSRTEKVPRNIQADMKVYTFSRLKTIREGVYDISTNYAYSFQLSDLPNYTEFTNLFDQFKITSITAKFIYSQSQASTVVPASTPAYSPMLYQVIDYNDATALSIPENYLQYQNCYVGNLIKTRSVEFQPKISIATYTGAFTGYGNTAMWIDTASSGTQHYGLKFYIEPLTSGTGSNLIGYLTIVLRYNLQFRQVR